MLDNNPDRLFGLHIVVTKLLRKSNGLQVQLLVRQGLIAVDNSRGLRSVPNLLMEQLAQAMVMAHGQIVLFRKGQ